MADMTSIARPYAKAIFEFALEHQQLESWNELLERMAQIAVDPAFETFITNPSSTVKEHAALMLGVMERFKTGDEPSHAKDVVGLLAHNHRLLVLPTILALYQDLRAAYEKTLTVDVVSFAPLTAEQVAALTTRLNQRLQRQITLDLTIDPDILGGMIVRAGHLVFDGSVRTQIKNLRTNLAA